MLFNVALPVVANIDAATPADAVARLRTALEAAGFDVYDDGTDPTGEAFEAEPGTIPTVLPDPRRVLGDDYDAYGIGDPRA